MLELNATDRCDRCSARAVAVAHKAGFTSLLFCRHHFRENHDALLNKYWLLEEEVSLETVDKVSVPTE